MPGTAELKTARLLLRRHVMEDALPLHEDFGRDEDMFAYSGWNPYATPEMAEQTVARFLASYDDPHTYAWAIEHEGRLVGTIGAYDYDAEAGTIEVGMSIAKPFWGQGFATEALPSVLRYLAECEGIARVTAWCAADNVGSRRALEKAGMVLESTSEGGLKVGDATYDRLDFVYG